MIYRFGNETSFRSANTFYLRLSFLPATVQPSIFAPLLFFTLDAYVLCAILEVTTTTDWPPFYFPSLAGFFFLPWWRIFSLDFGSTFCGPWLEEPFTSLGVITGFVRLFLYACWSTFFLGALLVSCYDADLLDDEALFLSTSNVTVSFLSAKYFWFSVLISSRTILKAGE